MNPVPRECDCHPTDLINCAAHAPAAWHQRRGRREQQTDDRTHPSGESRNGGTCDGALKPCRPALRDVSLLVTATKVGSDAEDGSPR